MKVGTDAVLLGAWVNILNTKNILEVGTGSGVISLMLAQRTLPETKIVAIEPDEQSLSEAIQNFRSSKFNNQKQSGSKPFTH